MAAIAFGCAWLIRCRPKWCEVLMLTLLGLAVTAALTAIAAIAGAGKPWTWMALMLITIAVAILSTILRFLVREIGLDALRRPERLPSPVRKKRTTTEAVPALAQSPKSEPTAHDQE
jgi:hypothetical protein